MISSIIDEEKKEQIARYILEDLPEWFGIEKSMHEYVHINGEKVDNTYREYPFVVYKGVTYLPLTYYDLS